METFPNPLLSLCAGLAAGLVAAAVMELVQTLLSKLSGSSGSSADSATARAANEASRGTTGEQLPKTARPKAGRGVHYATGIALGGLYGLLTHFWPEASLWNGAAYGLATWLLLDETLVPALGLAKAPWKAPFSSHAYSLAAHLAFGFALEGTRRLLLIALA